MVVGQVEFNQVHGQIQTINFGNFIGLEVQLLEIFGVVKAGDLFDFVIGKVQYPIDR